MKIKYLLLVAVITVLIAFSCRSTRNSASQPGGSAYDTAMFEYYLIEGMRQKSLGSNGDAVMLFENALKINPESDAALFQIAQILAQIGKRDVAAKYAIRASLLDPGNIWYLNFLGAMYYSEQKIDSAIIFYEKVMEADKNDENIKYTLANLYSEAGKTDKANELLSWFEEKYGTNETTSLSLIRNLMNSGRMQEAEDKLKKLLELKPDEIFYNGLLAEIYRAKKEDFKAVEIYNKLMDLDPGNPQTQLSIADYFFSKADFVNFLNTAGKIFINDRISREQKINLGIKMVENSDTLKQYSKDAELSLMILEANYKKDLYIPLLRAEFFSRIGQNSKSTELLKTELKNNPANFMAAENLMVVFSIANDTASLVLHGKELTTNFGRSFLVKILYAQGLLMSGDYKLTEEELRKAEILAGDKKENVLQVLTLRADLFYRKKQYQDSFRMFEEALKIDPKNGLVLNNYAYYLAETEFDTKKAVRLAEAALEVDRSNTVLDTYAWALYKNGNTRQAAEIMEEIVAGNASDSEYFEHYGFILEKLDRDSKACEMWQRALKLDASKVHLKEKIKKCTN